MTILSAFILAKIEKPDETPGLTFKFRKY